jgi:hypothetical protein
MKLNYTTVNGVDFTTVNFWNYIFEYRHAYSNRGRNDKQMKFINKACFIKEESNVAPT